MPAIKFLGSVERTFLESTMSQDIAFLIYANCATCVIRLLKCSPYRYRSESALVLASIFGWQKWWRWRINRRYGTDKYRSRLSSMKSIASGHVTAARNNRSKGKTAPRSRTARVNTEDASPNRFGVCWFFFNVHAIPACLKPVPDWNGGRARGRRTHRVIHLRAQRFGFKNIF